ncbi:MAG: lytic transglycosylase domain-containing protein [Hyphomicrobium sp.]
MSQPLSKALAAGRYDKARSDRAVHQFQSMLTQLRASTFGCLFLVALAPLASAKEAQDKTATGPPSQTTADSGALSPKAREAAHHARFDKIIAPVKAHKLPDANAKYIREAILAIAAKNHSKAAALEAKVTDPIGRKLINWYRLRRGHGDAAEYSAFLDSNPTWPSRDVLWQRLEQRLFLDGGNAIAIKGYFKDGKPQSASGLAALASVHLANGDTGKAKILAAEVWRQHDLPRNLEKGFLARFGTLLTEDDHKWRLDRLLVDDVRWKSGRNSRAARAKRVIPLLSARERTRAKARLAVFMRSRVSASRLKANPNAKSKDWGLVFHKAQLLRRAKKTSAAAKLVLSAPTDPKAIANLDEWWTERLKLAYQALKANNPKLAYKLVRDAGPLSVNPLNEQRSMAGWIALRYLKDANAAEKYFAAYTKSADGPLSRAKSNYWLARALEAKGNSELAAQHYRAAARERGTFHGLLAAQKLDPGRKSFPITAPAEPTPQQIARFNELDVVKAVAIAHKSKAGRSIARIFLHHIRTLEENEAWSAMVAHLAREIGDTQTSVRIGKAAIARGQNLIYYSYPVHALPDYKPLRSPPETAFLLGLARQETEFNTQIVSGAGARGILQVMKATARHVCRDYKIKCSNKRLLTDPSYNTMIASAYVADRLRDFSGSYVLGLSSYNAGPGRTRQWIREFGDPRTSKIDPIDWIERIPIKETRRYVAKVLANIQVYRARLGDEATALRISTDLNRARAASAPSRQNKSGGRTNTVKTGG